MFELDEVYTALQELVKVQAHYAHLLNTYDGGERREFKSAMEWILRLREVKENDRKAKAHSQT